NDANPRLVVAPIRKVVGADLTVRSGQDYIVDPGIAQAAAKADALRAGDTIERGGLRSVQRELDRVSGERQFGTVPDVRAERFDGQAVDCRELAVRRRPVSNRRKIRPAAESHARKPIGPVVVEHVHVALGLDTKSQVESREVQWV